MANSKKVTYPGDPKTYIIVDNQDFYCSKADYEADTNHVATAFLDGCLLQIYDTTTKTIEGYAISLENVWCDR